MNRWVIKIGTSLLRGNKEKTTFGTIEGYSACIAEAVSRGDQVIIVSSGAVGLGCLKLKINERPQEISALQAVAAVGQGQLMSLYERAMTKYGYNVAQVLLTRSDFGSKTSYNNASMTLKKLLDWKIIPIVNENDTLSAEELRFGDNDTLSALVATAVSADQLILLTDIDKLYSSDPKIDSEARPISDVHHLNELNQFSIDQSQSGNWGKGGMKTKLAAARIATQGGIPVQLSDGRETKILRSLLQGSRGGTVFHPSPNPIASRKSWLAHAIHPVGSIYLDNGASDAIQKRGASLLLVGVDHVEGEFSSNQPVRVINSKNEELARGICSLSSENLRSSLNSPISAQRSTVVIHRDVLVLTREI